MSFLEKTLTSIFFVSALSMATPAHADFIVSSAIIEFTGDGPRQQDIELISRSKENDYIVSEISEVLHPDSPDEKRRLIDDPAQGGLLATPRR